MLSNSIFYTLLELKKYDAKYFHIAKCYLMLDEPDQALKLLTEGRNLCSLTPEEKECYKELDDRCAK